MNIRQINEALLSPVVVEFLTNDHSKMDLSPIKTKKIMEFLTSGFYELYKEYWEIFRFTRDSINESINDGHFELEGGCVVLHYSSPYRLNNTQLDLLAFWLEKHNFTLADVRSTGFSVVSSKSEAVRRENYEITLKPIITE